MSGFSFGSLFPPVQSGGVLANLHAGFQDNPNAIMGAGLALLAHRQNAVANPLGQVAQNVMAGSQIDTRNKEAKRLQQLEEQDKNQSVQWIVDRGLGPSYDEVMKWPEVVRQQVIAEALKSPEKPDLPASFREWQLGQENPGYGEFLKRGSGPTPTDDMREYDYAKSQGYEGSFTDFMTDMRKASATTIQMPSEQGARMGLGDRFTTELNKPGGIKETVKTDFGEGLNLGNRARLAVGAGTPGAIARRIESGKEALVRQLTGAGSSQSEAENYAARYSLSPLDSAETMLDKLENLEAELAASKQGAIDARSGAMGKTPMRTWNPDTQRLE